MRICRPPAFVIIWSTYSEYLHSTEDICKEKKMSYLSFQNIPQWLSSCQIHLTLIVNFLLKAMSGPVAVTFSLLLKLFWRLWREWLFFFFILSVNYNLGVFISPVYKACCHQMRLVSGMFKKTFFFIYFLRLMHRMIIYCTFHPLFC